jgi:nucleic acid/nucleotide deaminase of polymorphic system toxin/uncharacterized protein DUF6244
VDGHASTVTIVTEWGTSAINRELGGAATGFEKALAVLTEAADYAERAARHMLPGFPGVARSIRQIKDAIEANHHEATELADQIAPLSHAVEAITSDWTPSEVIATLTPVAEKLSRLSRDTLYTANRRLGDAEVLIRRLLVGGSPEHLQARVSRPRSILVAVHNRLNRAKDAADTVLAAAREAGQSGTGSGGGQQPPGEPPPVPAGVPEEEPPSLGAGGRLPRPPIPGATHGLWAAPNGDVVMLRSGTGGQYYQAAVQRGRELGLTRDNRKAVPWIASHVEVQFAMRMVAENIQHAEIEINRPVCGTTSTDRHRLYTCHRWISRFLRPGQTLRIKDGTSPEGRLYTGKGGSV